MRVLVGCEYSNTVSQAFRDLGHDVLSCDLLPSEGPPQHHYQGDIMNLLDGGHRWDLGILHPDCTRMALCGNRWHAGTSGRDEAVTWTTGLWRLAQIYCKRVCLENPTSVIFRILRQWGADVQYIQPHKFGHPETKKTGIALHKLPRLKPTEDVTEYMLTLPKKERNRIHYMSPGADRGKERSRFYTGFAEAMADQWSNLDG